MSEPLGLEQMEASARDCERDEYPALGYADDVLLLVAEVRRLDAENALLSDNNAWLANEGDRLRAEVAALRAALAGLVGCIDTSAADNGPPITRGSMIAQVCKVLQKTSQYASARAALAGNRSEE